LEHHPSHHFLFGRLYFIIELTPEREGGGVEGEGGDIEGTLRLLPLTPITITVTVTVTVPRAVPRRSMDLYMIE
jgi:hypothetical protein